MRRRISILLLAIVLAGLLWPAGSSRAAGTNPGTTGLVSWWDLDETSGTRYDAFGNNDLSDNNTVGYAAGVSSNAADFVATNNEYLSIADNADVSMGNITFTIGFWVYISTDATYPLVFKSTGTTSKEWYFYNVVNTGVRFYVMDDGTGSAGHYTTVTTGALSTGAWHYIMAWHKADTDIVGISLDNGTPVTNTWTAGVFDGTAPLRFGASDAALMSGRLDEVVIYKRALTTDERTWLYNNGAGRSYADLAGGSTETPTSTPTASQTPSPSSTPTNTPTNTPTSTATSTYTLTPSETSTPTATSIYTDTPTDTPTITLTPSDTPTPTITLIPSDTPTPMDTPEYTLLSQISYGDVGTTVAISLLCLIIIIIAIAVIVPRLAGSKPL